MAPTTVDESARSIERWRVSLALVLLIGVLVATVGESISAAGAPEIGVVDSWGRIDEAVSQIATWQYLSVVGAAAFVLLGRFGFERIDLESMSSRRVAWLGVVVELVALATAAVVGMVAVFQRTSDADAVGGVGISDYYSQTEKIGETVAYAAIVIIAVGLLTFVTRGLRTKDVSP
ncbi:MAG: hypothetical protein WD598_05875 [Acidimicrobiia bacterium]